MGDNEYLWASKRACGSEIPALIEARERKYGRRAEKRQNQLHIWITAGYLTTQTQKGASSHEQDRFMLPTCENDEETI